MVYIYSKNQDFGRSENDRFLNRFFNNCWIDFGEVFGSILERFLDRFWRGFGKVFETFLDIAFTYFHMILYIVLEGNYKGFWIVFG